MSNLKLHFRFNTSGNTIPDQSGQGNDGSLQGNTSLVSLSPFGPCFQFDGNGDYISTKSTAATGFKDTSFTAMAWIKLNNLSTDKAIFGTDLNGLNKGLHLTIRVNKIHMGFYGNDLQGNTILNTDKWYHICWRYDKDKRQKEVYINGHLDGTQNNSAPFIGTGLVHIGRWSGARYFDGCIATVRNYDTALSPSDIRQIMLDDYDDLRLHFRLDEFQGAGQFSDSSGQGHLGSLQPSRTTPSLMPDDLFGSVLAFDGTQSIQIPSRPDLNIRGNLSISAWVWIDTGMNEWVRVVGQGNTADDRSYGLWYHHGTKRWLFQIRQSNHVNCIFVAPKIALKKWYHLAGVREGTQFRLYLDGKKVAKESVFDGAIDSTSHPLTIGASADHKKHRGRLANVRIYDRALAEADLADVITSDQSASATFRQLHPLWFSFQNEAEEAILYMDQSPAGHEMHLEIGNGSKKPIALIAKGDSVSADNYHFELRFRPGTILPASQTKIKLVAGKKTFSENPDHWAMAKQNRPDGSFSIYLLRKAPANASDKIVLALRESFIFTFHQVRADGQKGTRGTRVELVYQNLTYDVTGSAANNAEFIKGHRISHLDVVNHNGKSTIPFHLGFVGSNVVLNDTVGTPTGSDLTLRLSNQLKPDPDRPERSRLHLVGTDEDSEKPTELSISFDTHAAHDWALTTPGQVGGVQMSISVGNRSDVDNGDWKGQGQINPWTFVLQKSYTLAAGEYLEIHLNNIKSSLPAGHANIYVHYQGVSGYWPQKLVAIAEKSPLLFYHVPLTKRENVGIGFTKPLAKLAINGGLHIGGTSDPGDNNLQIDGSIGIGVVPSSSYGITMGKDIRSRRFVHFDNSSYFLDPLNESQLNKLKVSTLKISKLIDSDNETYGLNPSATSKLNVLNTNSLNTGVIYTGKIIDRDNDSFYLNPSGYSKLNRLEISTGDFFAFIVRNSGKARATIMAINSADGNAIRGENNSPNWAAVFGENKHAKGWDFFANTRGNYQYGRASSIRLKKDIHPIEGALKTLLQLEGVHFTWKETECEDIGFIAEHIAEHIPSAVNFDEDGFANGMSYDHVLPILVQAVKEQQAMIDELRKQIAAFLHPQSH